MRFCSIDINQIVLIHKQCKNQPLTAGWNSNYEQDTMPQNQKVVAFKTKAYKKVTRLQWENIISLIKLGYE